VGDEAELIREGVAVVVGTRDASLRPAVTRGWGPNLSGDGAALTLMVDAPEGSPTRVNLGGGSPVAVTLSRPTSYASVQLKGPVVAVRAPSDAELASMRSHVEAFVTEAVAMGVRAAVARSLVGDDVVVVEIAVAERYDQTPGPGAGRRL
jgi:hypothetical protein